MSTQTQREECPTAWERERDSPLAPLFISVIALPELFSQNFSLVLNCRGIKADSIHLQIFDGRKDFQNVLSVPFAKQVTLKQKAALPAGFYAVAADTTMLFTLLISEEKKQHSVYPFIHMWMFGLFLHFGYCE